MFNDFITNLYNKKRDSTGFLKLIYKQILNNFLGRFGLNFFKPITETVDKKKRDLILATRDVYSELFLVKNKILITYNPIISKEKCLEHGLDILKILEKESKGNIEKKLDSFKDYCYNCYG